MTHFAESGPGRDVGRYVGITMRETEELHLVGHAPVAPHLCDPAGAVRTGALLTMLDNVGGLNGGLAALPNWVVSTNLAARVVALAHAGPLRIDSTVLRRGRNNVVTTVQIRDEGAADTLVASGVLTSAILVPENGPPQWPRPLVLDTGLGAAADLPAIPEWLGIRPAGADTVEIDLSDELRNPWGILHGGVVATLVDLAAGYATGGGSHHRRGAALPRTEPRRPRTRDGARHRHAQRRHGVAGRGHRHRSAAHHGSRDRHLRAAGLTAHRRATRG